MFSATDADGSEVRVMTTGERAGWNVVLREASLGYAPATLAKALTEAADRADRAVDTHTRRGWHELAAISADVALVLDHAAERVGPYVSRV